MTILARRGVPCHRPPDEGVDCGARGPIDSEASHEAAR